MAVALRQLEMIDQTPEQLHRLTLGRDAKEAGIKNYVPPTFTDVYYGTHQRQVLDFWQADSGQPTPVVFHIHGGSWTSGSKIRIFNDLDVARLMERGISVVSINYRYVSQAPKNATQPPVRTSFYDAARALQFVRSNSKQWNLDKTQIAVSGTSAGACTGLWLASRNDLADPSAADLVARESSRPFCAAVSNARTTLDPLHIKEWTPSNRYGAQAFGLKTFEDFLAKRDELLPWIQQFSPHGHLSGDDPPIALFYSRSPKSVNAQKDPNRIFGARLQQHCRTAGVDCYLYFEGSDDPRYGSKTEYLIDRLNRK